MQVWFLVLILAGDPGAIEQKIVVPMPTKATCQDVLELGEDIPVLSRMYYPNKHSVLRDIRKRECRAGIL